MQVVRRNDTCYLENTKIKVIDMNSSYEVKGDEMEREGSYCLKY